MMTARRSRSIGRVTRSLRGTLSFTLTHCPQLRVDSSLSWVAGVIAIAGCGATRTTTATTATRAAAASLSSSPAWEHGTPPPKVTPALIGQAGYGLTTANANLGTVDEVCGAVPANVHVNPSAKALDDQYARFGRCMAEQMKIHDLGHELALLIAYNRKDHTL